MAKAGKKSGGAKKVGRSAAAKPARPRSRSGASVAIPPPASGSPPDLGDAAREVRALREEAAAARAEVRAVREECARALAQIKAIVGATGGAPGETAPAPTPAPVPETGNRLGVTVAPGVVVAEVLPRGLAAEAGILRGDVVEAVNDRPVYSGPDLRESIRGLAAGSEVTLRIRRADNPLDVIAVLGEPGEAEDGNRLGVAVAPGVVVAEVRPGGPADAAGIARGDVIEVVDGQEVHTADQLRAAVLAHPPRSEVVLSVTRSGKVRRVTARLDGAAG